MSTKHPPPGYSLLPSGRVLLLDTNVLLLLLVGLWNKAAITKFERTSNFTEQDFELVQAIVARFNEIATTPHILAEVNSLAGLHRDPERAQFFQDFATRSRALFDQQLLSEHFLPARSIIDSTDRAVFSRLRFTDSAIAAVATTQNLHVLTTDFALWAHLQKNNILSTNFNHLRSASPFMH